ncbi:transposase [Paeniroseomonas aquatica]|uniref:Transposase n=1 Tax=Paeniroseomonas aquatica TaxID=373043 RepID=A0ABT8AAI3_9PROT|nr:transposase [Paeniroseomonas aquatica]MDN3566837.1 transposase [Paeniroseomonas aquatica]
MPILPATFPTRADLIHRISLAPLTNLTTPTPWAPLTDAEWDHIAPFLAAMNCGLSLSRRPGRPPEDTRARLDAIFRAVTLKHPKGGRGCWSQLPEGHGKPDTVSRTYRRWAHADLWARLLVEVACPTAAPVLRRLTYLVCCAYRRAIRLMGTLRAILLARRAGLHSALPGPSCLLPDPDLSEHLWPLVPAILDRVVAEPGWRPPPGALRGLAALHRFAAGRRRLSRWMEPA